MTTNPTDAKDALLPWGKCHWKWVMRYSQRERLFRIFRIVWDGKYPSIPSRKLSVAVRTKIHWEMVRIRLRKSYGGRYV